MTDRPSRPNIGTIERVVAMGGLPGTSDLSPNELSVLASIARARRVPPGHVLSRPGHPTSSLFLVVEGALGVRRRGTTEQNGAGSAVGVLEAFSHDAEGLDCVAPDGAVVLEVALDDLEDVFDELPNVLLEVASDIARSALALPRAPHPPSPGTDVVVLPSRPLDLVERILFLRRCRALRGASIDAIAALANTAREQRVAQKEPLIRAGAPANALFVVAAGELEVGSGGEAIRRSGDLVGELEVLGGVPHASQALARSPLVALVIDRDGLFDAFEDHADLGVELLREASSELLARRDHASARTA